MAFKVERLSRERESDMTSIKVAKATYYLHKGRAYKKGGGEPIPSGAQLLVREGSPVMPAVIEQYGIEVGDAENVVRVPDAGRTPARDIGVGVSDLAKKGLERLAVTDQVHRETADFPIAAQSSGAGSSRQAAMLREAIVDERLKEQGGVDATQERIEPGTAAAREVAAQSSGIGSAPINEKITAELEEGEREATARHARAIMEAGRGKEDDGSTDAGGIKPSSITPGESSITKEIAPGGEDAQAKLREEKARTAEEEKARIIAEEEARTKEAGNSQPQS